MRLRIKKFAVRIEFFVDKLRVEKNLKFFFREFFPKFFIPSKERELRKEAQKEADWEALLEEKREKTDDFTKMRKPDLDDLLDL